MVELGKQVEHIGGQLFGLPISRIRWDDGCKVYFEDGGWITVRFSGTEPVLRVFCEMENEADALAAADLVAAHLGLGA